MRALGKSEMTVGHHICSPEKKSPQLPGKALNFNHLGALLAKTMLKVTDSGQMRIAGDSRGHVRWAQPFKLLDLLCVALPPIAINLVIWLPALILNGVYSLREATYCSTPFEFFYF